MALGGRCAWLGGVVDRSAVGCEDGDGLAVAFADPGEEVVESLRGVSVVALTVVAAGT